MQHPERIERFSIETYGEITVRLTNVIPERIIFVSRGITVHGIFCILQLISGGISWSMSCKIYTDISPLHGVTSYKSRTFTHSRQNLQATRPGQRAWQPRNWGFDVGGDKGHNLVRNVTTASKAHPKASEVWKWTQHHLNLMCGWPGIVIQCG